jgi:hypothetical protein
MRPVFEVELRAPGPAVLAEIRRALDRGRTRVDGAVLRGHAELTTHRDEAHFWSPHLSLELIDRGDGAWAVKGRFAPEPNVWILFMSVYGILAMAAIAGLMYGTSQALVGEKPWALLGAPAGLALMAFTYGAAFIGQGLGAEEMYQLRSFVDDCVSAAERLEGPGADPQI